MAERSKALASGASREICVGSNPTLVNIFFGPSDSFAAVGTAWRDAWLYLFAIPDKWVRAREAASAGQAWQGRGLALSSTHVDVEA